MSAASDAWMLEGRQRFRSGRPFGRADGVNAHEHCAYLHLTAADHVKKEGGKISAAVSVDQAVAKLSIPRSAPMNESKRKRKK